MESSRSLIAFGILHKNRKPTLPFTDVLGCYAKAASPGMFRIIFAEWSKKLQIATAAINHPGSSADEADARGSAYAPRIIMIIGGLIKTLRYNAPDKRQSRGPSIGLNNATGMASPNCSWSAILAESRGRD